MTVGTFIRKAIRRLERRYGSTITLKNELERATNYQTGSLTRTYESFTLADCMVRPVTLNRDFAYGLSFLAANKNFTFGGKFDKGVRQVTILRDRLPQGFRVDLRTLIFIDNDPCIIKLVEKDETEGHWFYRLIVVQTESADLASVSVQPARVEIALSTVNPTVIIA